MVPFLRITSNVLGIVPASFRTLWPRADLVAGTLAAYVAERNRARRFPGPLRKTRL
jgi:hypothetical protein